MASSGMKVPRVSSCVELSVVWAIALQLCGVVFTVIPVTLFPLHHFFVYIDRELSSVYFPFVNGLA